MEKTLVFTQVADGILRMRLSSTHGKTLDELLKMGHDVGVAWQDGRQHGGSTHIRLNLALPLSRVKEAFRRMDKYVFNGADI